MSSCRHVEDEKNQLCISAVPIFNHLKQDEMKEIVKTTHMKKFSRGEIIYEAGENSDYMYILHRGRVKIYYLSETGKEQLIRIMEPGDFMGELSLFSKSTFDHYAGTMENTEICIMRQQDLQAFLLKWPSISLKLLDEFSKRLLNVEKLVSDLTSKDVEKRTASYLVNQAEKEGSLSFTLPLSKKELASYLGTTPESISRKLAEFQEQGFLILSGQKNIKLLELDQLRNI
ncbi:Crp/Fnr family transcriptional regulator [Cytobacillus massiliigabonensis]|uniref:Crp/Fnr family transcriptional regulator n=1 Tax=Cytobacillus massiliigabonensis TaxID=1871011 RepID=UPI001C1267FA|nr:Crp/Fnr family transcriptional regulator [Cytobacillus massiliigabonensis]